MARQFYPLVVSDVEPIISGRATSVSFAVPEYLRETFRWLAGQHLTVRVILNGEEHRRCYTISNPPEEALRITVKRVAGGLVSNHFADHLSAGDTLEIMPPFGGFTLMPGATARRTHYFFGAGSGITPLYAMVCSLLVNEPYSVAHLVLGNAREKEIIFRNELDALQAAYPDRLTVRHTLSSQSMWSGFSPWRRGRVDEAAIQAAIAQTPPVAQDAQYWICGPGGMNADVARALANMDVPKDRIHMESFGGERAADDGVTGVAATAQVRLDGKTTEVAVGADQTVLEAVLAAGLSPSFSCQSGVCGACRAKLTSGDVHMRAHMALEDKEVLSGEILTCQSVATSKHLKVNFPE
ncbi:ferredoxin--NADP reductase [Shimia haliotis]|uniref:Ring-1,2-phenylacetyl-CoA epoxidase subunit PaaE n=1 Tax=Shimia haliotis TaxID=1280847 RepID=A0A1I4HJN2_9RHOB|nr:ferredoxin--NADP reductase [Shimia haliotis]SFL41596.1 ring-1,2-phenylacetyl-CoA epoxidase subunit PaaE [Shimia haliotis]